MNKNVFILLLCLLLGCNFVYAQQTKKSDLQQRAEAESKKGSITGARSLYIRAFDDYASKGQTKQGLECGVKAAELYYKESLYKEAFELLRRIDQGIEATGQKTSSSDKAAMHYLTTRERFQMYMKLRKGASITDQLNIMERQAALSGEEDVQNDLLYNKTIYYYTFGQNDKGNATFKEMADKLTSKKEYDKVDEVYQTLIANGRRSNSASLVAQSYNSYMAWKDSVSALKVADEIGALKQQIADNEETISEKDSSLGSRKAIIVGLSILVALLVAALVLGAAILLRFILLTRKQKKTIRLERENNALKAKFMSNISAQIAPAVQKLDRRMPEVKALLDFSNHIQTLSTLECSTNDPVELEEVQIPQFCETMIEEIRHKVKDDTTLTVNAPKMSARLNKEYVTHILRHLLNNAVTYAPAGSHITLDFKKRGIHKYQFLVSNTGSTIPEEKREDVFKPFLEIRDLTKGDGLGLPICMQMAQRMNGDLSIDPNFTKGTRFVLDLHD